MSDFSDFGERTTDAFLAKKVEAEVKKLKTTTSAVLQTVFRMSQLGRERVSESYPSHFLA
jgi:hypothetical protein